MYILNNAKVFFTDPFVRELKLKGLRDKEISKLIGKQMQSVLKIRQKPTGQFNWIFPPFSTISRLIFHAIIV